MDHRRRLHRDRLRSTPARRSRSATWYSEVRRGEVVAEEVHRPRWRDRSSGARSCCRAAARRSRTAPTVERSRGAISYGKPTSPSVSSLPAWWIDRHVAQARRAARRALRRESAAGREERGVHVAVAIPGRLAVVEHDAVHHAVAEEPVRRPPRLAGSSRCARTAPTAPPESSRVRELVTSISSVTGAKLPCRNHGFAASSADSVVGVLAVVGPRRPRGTRAIARAAVAARGEQCTGAPERDRGLRAPAQERAPAQSLCRHQSPQNRDSCVQRSVPRIETNDTISPG